MPCDTVTRVELNIENADMDIMKKVLEEKGYSVTQHGENTLTFRDSDFNNGTFNRRTGTMSTRYDNMGWFKASYTTELVKRKVSKYGWGVKQTGENKFEVLKR